VTLVCLVQIANTNVIVQPLPRVIRTPEVVERMDVSLVTWDPDVNTVRPVIVLKLQAKVHVFSCIVHYIGYKIHQYTYILYTCI
jgi:hypothetical protein